MNDNNYSLQPLLAKLVTNPRCLIGAICNPVEYIKTLNLNKQQSLDLKEFLNKSCFTFLSSSLLLSRKRFLGVLDTFNYLHHYLDYESLDIYWHKYLFSFKLNENSPKNPLYESIHFCNYLLEKELLDKKSKALVSYEKYRNETILAYNQYVNESQKNDLYSKPFLIHPCAKMQTFEFDIALLIKTIEQKNMEYDKKINIVEKHTILFYKNFNNGKIYTINVKDNFINLIKILKRNYCMHKAFKQYAELTNITQTNFEAIIKKLSKIGLCCHTQIFKEDVINV